MLKVCVECCVAFISLSITCSGALTVNCDSVSPVEPTNVTCTCVNSAGSGVQWFKNGTHITDCFKITEDCLLTSGYTFYVNGSSSIYTVTEIGYSYSACSSFFCYDLADHSIQQWQSVSVADFNSTFLTSMNEPANSHMNGNINFTTECLYKANFDAISVATHWLAVVDDVEKSFEPNNPVITQDNSTCQSCNQDSAVKLHIGFDHIEDTSEHRTQAKVRISVFHDGFPSGTVTVTSNNVYYINVAGGGIVIADGSLPDWAKYVIGFGVGCIIIVIIIIMTCYCTRPRNVQCLDREKSDTSITLIWDPPCCCGGCFGGFILYYTEVIAGAKRNTKGHTDPLMKNIIPNLHPLREYEIQMCTKLWVGTSAKTPKFRIMTYAAETYITRFQYTGGMEGMEIKIQLQMELQNYLCGSLPGEIRVRFIDSQPGSLIAFIIDTDDHQTEEQLKKSLIYVLEKGKINGYSVSQKGLQFCRIKALFNVIFDITSLHSSEIKTAGRDSGKHDITQEIQKSLQNLLKSPPQGVTIIRIVVSESGNITCDIATDGNRSKEEIKKLITDKCYKDKFGENKVNRMRFEFFSNTVQVTEAVSNICATVGAMSITSLSLMWASGQQGKRAETRQHLLENLNLQAYRQHRLSPVQYKAKAVSIQPKDEKQQTSKPGSKKGKNINVGKDESFKGDTYDCRQQGDDKVNKITSSTTPSKGRTEHAGNRPNSNSSESLFEQQIDKEQQSSDTLAENAAQNENDKKASSSQLKGTQDRQLGRLAPNNRNELQNNQKDTFMSNKDQFIDNSGNKGSFLKDKSHDDQQIDETEHKIRRSTEKYKDWNVAIEEKP